ncbi:MAG: NAD-dependent epimerase/dehydratase family protein [Dehalococcoidia bacterium]
MSEHRVLITGGLGYVGSRLCPHLLAAGHTVRSLDLGLYGNYGIEDMEAAPEWGEWRGRFSSVIGDIRDPSAVQEALTGMDTVIHLAAISNDPTGEVDDAMTRQVNHDAVGLLVALAKEAGVQRFINASSSSVFGIKDQPDVVELLEPEPISSYSRYKALAEWIVVCAASSSFCTVNVRPATICGYSPRQRFDLTVNKLTADAIRKGVITVHGGQQRRPNVSMGDVIDLYQRLLDVPAEKINGRTFNFGFENHKVIEIANIIREELADLPVEIKVTDVLDQRDYHISSSKLQRTLGYEPEGSIRQAVAELRRELIDNQRFQDIDAPQHYNMKMMKMERNPAAYRYLARD